jgi:hypothetical protein
LWCLTIWRMNAPFPTLLSSSLNSKINIHLDLSCGLTQNFCSMKSFPFYLTIIVWNEDGWVYFSNPWGFQKRIRSPYLCFISPWMKLESLYNNHVHFNSKYFIKVIFGINKNIISILDKRLWSIID